MRAPRAARDEEGGADLPRAGERAAVEAIPSIEKAVFATEDFKEGIQSFIERREARFQGR